MRALFLLLVLANLAFYAWTRHFASGDSAADAQPLARQLEPERLRVLGAGERSTPSQNPPERVACLEWGDFSLAEAERARNALAPLALGGRLGERRIDEGASWWVYMPPQGSRERALRKAGELRALGETDYYIVQEDGPIQWSISLGIYRSEGAAQGRLAALREKGVRTAVVGPREPSVEKLWLQVRDVDPALRARLAATAQDFAGSELRECGARS